MVKAFTASLIIAFGFLLDITLHASFAMLMFAAFACSLVLIVIAGNCWALGSETAWVSSWDIADLPRNVVATLGEIPTIIVGIAFLGTACLLKVVLDKLDAVDIAETVSRFAWKMRRA